ncbi:MAG: hypothetical protein K5756_02585 [Clostridiales bacterium]|nr:hypothetical protein [Clostridiales bacterium]
MKKVLSVLLAAAFCFLLSGVAFAQEESPLVYCEFLNNELTYEIVVVLTYDSAYSQVGELPEVTLKDASQNEKPLSPEDILQQVFFYEGVYYPQLFVRIPEKYANEFIDDELCVGAGAFQDKTGSRAAAVSVGFNDMNIAMYNITGCSDYIIPDSRIFADSRKTVLAGTTVKTDTDFSYKYGDVWKNASALSAGDEKIDFEFAPEEPGTYHVVCRLNDFVWDEYTFTALDKKQAHLQGMRSCFNDAVLLPEYLATALTWMFVPISGLSVGLILFFYGLVHYPYMAIKSIFSTPFESGFFM